MQGRKISSASLHPLPPLELGRLHSTIGTACCASTTLPPATATFPTSTATAAVHCEGWSQFFSLCTHARAPHEYFNKLWFFFCSNTFSVHSARGIYCICYIESLARGSQEEGGGEKLKKIKKHCTTYFIVYATTIKDHHRYYSRTRY